MSTQFRIDTHRLDARPLRKDARGFALVSSWATRTGIFEYTRADGSKVRELRSADEVFAPAHLDSIAGASVTVGHPTGHVTPANVRALEVGVVSSARRDGRFVAADLSIRDGAAIGKVERRELVELSCGYALTIDPTPGVHEGQRYDQVQRNLRCNHIALLPQGGGRAGRECALRMDAAGALIAPAFFYDEGDQPMISRELLERAQAAGVVVGRTDHQQREAEQEQRLDALAKKNGRMGYDPDQMSGYDAECMTPEERFEAAVEKIYGTPAKGGR